MALGKRLRFEVFRRDGYRCVYCGLTAKEARLTIDHVIPEALGGTDDVGNLVTACVDCNAGKTSTNTDEAFVAQVTEDTTRWRRAMATAAKIRRQDYASRDADVTKVEEAWKKWTYKRNDQPVPMPADCRTSIERYLVSGLPVEEMLRLIPVAMNATTRTKLDFTEWRYYMGCCKRVLADIEKTARELIAAKDSATAPSVDERSADGMCAQCEEAPITHEEDQMCDACEQAMNVTFEEMKQMDEWFASRARDAARAPRLADLP